MSYIGLSEGRGGLGWGAGSQAAAVVTRTFAAASADATDLTTYTFSGVSFGTAASNRKIAVCIGWRAAATRTISSATIGGVAATTVVSQNSGAGAASTVAIIIADVPTGTSGDVTITLSAGGVRMVIAVYAIYGAGSSTPTDTAVGTADPFTDTINISAGGVCIGVGHDTATTTATWTGITEDYDAQTETQMFTFASDEFATQQTGLTLVCNPASSLDGCFCAASFAP